MAEEMTKLDWATTSLEMAYDDMEKGNVASACEMLHAALADVIALLRSLPAPAAAEVPGPPMERVARLRHELAKQYQKAQIYGSLAAKWRALAKMHGAPEGRLDADPCTDERVWRFVNAIDAEQPEASPNAGALREQSQRIADLERLYAEACRELDEERDKVSRMMQPMPTDAVPGESSQVWRMLQQWTANRDVEKRQERERQRRDEARIAELEERAGEQRDALEAQTNANRYWMDAAKRMESGWDAEKRHVADLERQIAGIKCDLPLRDEEPESEHVEGRG